jgi:hypothetical protein
LKAVVDDTDVVDESCDDPEIVKLMIEYFYHFNYLRAEDATGSPATSKVHLIEHAKVFALAVKYQADGLRELAISKFKESIEANWNHEDLSHAIHIVYQSTTDDVTELRDIVTDTVHDHFDELNGQETVKAVVSSIASLAYGLLERFRTTQPKKSTCSFGHYGESKIRKCSNCRYRNEECNLCYDIGRRLHVCRNCGDYL